MGRREWLLLGTLSVLWGGSFVLGKVALHELRPLTIVLARIAVAAAALHLLVGIAGLRMPRDARAWGGFLVMGALNNVLPFSLIFWALMHVESGLASILTATTPLFTVLLAHAFTRDERMSWSKLAGVAFGVAGVAVILGAEALRGLGQHAAGQLAVVAAAISYAAAGVFGRRFRHLPPAVPAAGQLTCSTAMMLPAALLAERPWLLAAPGAGTWAAVLALGLLSTALAYVIYFRILATAGATNMALVTFLMPVSTVLLAAGLLGEQLGARSVLGLALISAGLLAIDGRAVAWARRPGFTRRRRAP